MRAAKFQSASDAFYGSSYFTSYPPAGQMNTSRDADEVSLV